MPANPQPFRWPAGRRAAVSLTWDDARRSQVEVGIPILNDHGLRGTFFVLPDALRPRLAKWRQAVEAGHEIGNHTIHHPCSGNFDWVPARSMLESYTLERMETELLRANARLRSALGVRPTSFAYCCGQTFVGRGAAVRSYVPLVAKHFLVGRTYLNESNNRPDRCDLAQVAGRGFDNRTWPEILTWIDAAAAGGGWIVLAGHEVGAAGARQTTSANVLRRLCSHLARRPEIWVDTVSAVGRHLRG